MVEPGFFGGDCGQEGDFTIRGRGSANRMLILQIEMLFLQTEYQSANRWIGPANRKADSANKTFNLQIEP